MGDYGLTTSESRSLKDVIVGADSRSHRNLLNMVLSYYASKNGARFWGEKTPGHVFYLNRIQRAFPNSQIIHLVRDPRDVVLSLAEREWGQGYGNEAGIALQWKRAIRNSFYEVSAQNLHFVRYESLVTWPRKVIRRLCQDVGLQFEPGMLEPSRRFKNFDPNEEPWKARASQPIDTSKRRRWKSEMPIAERRVVCSLARREMRRFGYREIQGAGTLSEYWALGGAVLRNGLALFQYWITRLRNFIVR